MTQTPAKPMNQSHDNHNHTDVVKNPQATKDSPNIKNDGIISNTEAAAGFVEDKRQTARQEHTNHFTNREGHPKK